jgi:hypothetical protein
MLSPSDHAAPGPHSTTRRDVGLRFPRLSPTGGFLLGLALLVPFALAVIGGLALIGSINGESIANAYRTAGPCDTPSATPNCYTVEAASLRDIRVVRGSGGDTTFFTAVLAASTVSTWSTTSLDEKNALMTATAVRVQVYQHKVTAVYVGDFSLVTRDTPTRGLSGPQLPAATLFIGLVGIALVLLLYGRNPQIFGVGRDQATDQEEEKLHEEFLQAYPAPAVPATEQVVLPREFRPHWGLAPGTWWLRPLAIAIGFPLIALRGGSSRDFLIATLIGSAVVAISMVGARLLEARGRVLAVDELNVALIDWWGSRQTVARSQISRVALRTLSSFGGPTASEPRLMLLSADGRCLLRVSRFNLQYDEARALAAILRVPIDPSWERFTTRADLAREIPDSLSWADAHLILAHAIRAGVLLAIVLLYVWALQASHR